MKQIKAFIDPTRLDELRVHLESSGVQVLTLHHGYSVGRKPERLESYRGSRYVVAQIPELEIAIVVPDEHLPMVIATIEQHGGEGDILISPVDQIIRVSKRNGSAHRGLTATVTTEGIPAAVAGRRKEAAGILRVVTAARGAA